MVLIIVKRQGIPDPSQQTQFGRSNLRDRKLGVQRIWLSRQAVFYGVGYERDEIVLFSWREHAFLRMLSRQRNHRGWRSLAKTEPCTALPSAAPPRAGRSRTPHLLFQF